MAVLEQAQLDELRRRLEGERAQLQEDTDTLETNEIAAGAKYDPEFSSEGNHPAESGSELYDQELSLAIDRGFGSELEQVERALAKLDEGTYGQCDVCGKDIGLERLQVLPHATLCIDDQAKQDAQRPQ